MKLSKVDRVRRATQSVIETLENRSLFAATLLSMIPAQHFQINEASPSVSLNTYFNDTAVPAGDTVFNFQTNLAAPNNSIPVYMSTATTPGTVANFLKYVNSGRYANTIIHRSIKGFVIQGGGYYTDGTAVTSYGNIQGESSTATFKNTTGTIAMALSSGPNTGNTNWFFNLANNTTGSVTNLDDTSDGGPFTAFGTVFYNGLTVIQNIAAYPYINDVDNGAWTNLPVPTSPYPNGTQISQVPADVLITINPVQVSNGVTYTVTSSNNSIVTPVITNGVLTFTSGGAGSANVTVTATDLGGGVATSMFAVNVSAAPTVAIADAGGIASAGGQVIFPVTLSAASDTDVTLNYSLTAGTAPATDFSAAATSITIPAGSTTANIPVDIAGNSAGAAETFTLTITSITGDATFAGGATFITATGTISPVVGVTPVITNTILPAQLIATVAAKGSATVNVINSSASTEKGVVSIQLYASTNDSIDGAILIGSADKKVNLDSGETATVNVPIKLSTNTLPVGTYTLIAKATDPSADSNISTSGPTKTVDAPVVSLAEAFAGLSLPPAVLGNAPIKASATVVITNNGNVPMKGLTTIELSASTTTGVAGTSIKSVGKTLNIPAGKSKSVAVPITMVPVVADGDYFLVASTTSPFDGAVTVASTATTTNIAAGFVSLSSSFPVLPKTSIAPAIITVNNNGNITESATFTATVSIATDLSGTSIVQSGVGIVSPKKLTIKAAKSGKLKVTGFGALTSALSTGSYYYTVTITDGSGNTTTSVSPVFAVS